MIPLRHSFVGGDHLRRGLGQVTFTNRDAAKLLKSAVDMQYNTRQRNNALPAAYQLDQEKDILPVDQSISDQGNFIQQYDDDKGVGWFWDQPATPSQRNAALTIQGLVKALDARERDQERKANANPNPTAPQTNQGPSAAKPEKTSGAILVVIAVAAFATAFFLSNEDWGGLPWSKDPHKPPPPEPSPPPPPAAPAATA